MAEILELLLPHMGRWCWLYIRCPHSSSLPHPLVDLCGSALSLHRLSLTFLIDNLVFRRDCTLSVIADLNMPSLRVLSMSGVHFRRSYVDHPLETGFPLCLQHLFLAGYDVRNPPFLLADVLR